jgi:hypothetical protein
VDKIKLDSAENSGSSRSSSWLEGGSNNLTAQWPNCEQVEEIGDDIMERLQGHELILRSMQYNSFMMRTLMFDLLDLAQMEKDTLTINNEFFDLF